MSFPWRYNNSSKNHGNNAAEDDLRRYPFRVEDSALVPEEKGQKGRKCQTFSDHTHPTVSSKPRGRCVQSLVETGSEMWICIRYKQTNKHSALYISFQAVLHCQHFITGQTVIMKINAEKVGYSDIITKNILFWRFPGSPRSSFRRQSRAKNSPSVLKITQNIVSG